VYNINMTKTDKETEPKTGNSTHKLNWLRASVLGANDGIVSIAGLVLGVAGATDSPTVILTAGIAGIVAGAISMAAGEYVSVSSSRDTERAILRRERYELENFPEEEFKELVAIYQQKGLSLKTAEATVKELSKKDVFTTHAHAEYNLDPNVLTNPWHAAFASAAAFLAGSMIPLFAIALPPSAMKVPVAFVSVIIALAMTGYLSARAGGASTTRAMLRVTFGGALAMIVTYYIGKLFAISGI
jgi:vacuolar iron transporter family protein